MIIDSHQHYWQIERGDYGWLTSQLTPIFRDFLPGDLTPLLASAKVHRTIVVQAAPTEAESQFLLDLAQRELSIAGVVGWVDFDKPDAHARIEAMAENPMLVGLRPMIHDIADLDWMLTAAVDKALVAMERAGLVLDALVRPVHLTRLTNLAKRHPDLTIVVDHCAKPAIRDGILEPWASDITALAANRNVMVKLSGLVTEAAQNWNADDLLPYVQIVFNAFGSGRVLWGSDWPVVNLAGDYANWMIATGGLLEKQTPEARAAIMGDNAKRVYLSNRGRI